MSILTKKGKKDSFCPICSNQDFNILLASMFLCLSNVFKCLVPNLNNKSGSKKLSVIRSLGAMLRLNLDTDPMSKIYKPQPLIVWKMTPLSSTHQVFKPQNFGQETLALLQLMHLYLLSLSSMKKTTVCIHLLCR